MTSQAVPYHQRTVQAVSWQRTVRHVAIAGAAVVLLVWTVFPFVWILLTSLKSPGDMLSVPPKFVFTPTIDNYAALVIGEQRGQYSSTRPDFPLFFLNSMIISFGAVALSVVAGIPAAYALARFTFPLKNGLAFVLMSFRFVPFIAFLIPLYLLYQRRGLYNTHAGLIFADGDPGGGQDRRLLVVRRADAGDSAAHPAGRRGQGDPGLHVLLERLQLSADAGRPPDLPGDRRHHPVHLLRAGAVGPDGRRDDRRRAAAVAAEPDGAEVHRARADHGSGAVP